MKNTLAAKVNEGFHSQGWQALGRGGTWAGAMRPLEAYVNRKIERAVRAEREACAKVCEQLGEDSGYNTGQLWGRGCANAIRARSKG